MTFHADGCESIENRLRWIVDVRDVAEALFLVYEKPEAEGRYICTAHSIRARDLVEKLRSIYPSYNKRYESNCRTYTLSQTTYSI